MEIFPVHRGFEVFCFSGLGISGGFNVSGEKHPGGNVPAGVTVILRRLAGNVMAAVLGWKTPCGNVPAGVSLGRKISLVRSQGYNSCPACIPRAGVKEKQGAEFRMAAES